MNVAISAYGIKNADPFTVVGGLVIIIAVLHFFTAYSLWLEKDYAIKTGQINAVFGIIICFLNMISPEVFDNYNFMVRVEIIPLAFFLYKLNKINNDWKLYTH